MARLLLSGGQNVSASTLVAEPGGGGAFPSRNTRLSNRKLTPWASQADDRRDAEEDLLPGGRRGRAELVVSRGSRAIATEGGRHAHHVQAERGLRRVTRARRRRHGRSRFHTAAGEG